LIFMRFRLGGKTVDGTPPRPHLTGPRGAQEKQGRMWPLRNAPPMAAATIVADGRAGSFAHCHARAV